LKKPLNYIFVAATTITLCSIPLFKISFAETLSPLDFFLLLLASILTGLEIANLSKAFVTFYTSYFMSVILTIIAVRIPLDIFMGSLAGDLATIVVARNIVFFSFLTALPFTVIFLVLGTYLGEKIRR